ncbi:AMP-binding protein [Actinoplanes sp. NPDC051861]|uniref:(2,3-dihydroxybenzoyl)adenylate synthase n=1 Tax=Actinoplanes sp. NPDC051861 TaxID=3155170 RepID=UPI00342FB2EB
MTVSPTRDGVVPWPAEVAARYARNGWWDDRTLTAPVLAAADARPEAVALVDGGVRMTYRELAARVDGTAIRLRELGLRRDDRIVVQLPTGPEVVVLTLGCLRAGVVPVMAVPDHRRREIGYLVRHAEARALAVPAAFHHRNMAYAIAAESPTLDHVLVAGDTLDDLIRPAPDPARARRELDSAAPDSRDVALMVLSGGVDTVPRLIPRTHDDYGCHVRRAAELSGFGPDTVYLAVLPMAHSMPLGMMLATLRSGGRVVVAPSPAPTAAFDVIEREGVTATAVVPAIARSWLRARPDRRRLSSVHIMLVGGAHLPAHVAHRIVPALARRLQQGYGMAEGLVCLTRLDDPDEVARYTQGRPICDDDELLVVDEHDHPVPDGEPGLLLTRGPCTPRGYYRAAGFNARAFAPGGWLRTGDIVRRRPDGNIVIVGRAKDMINRGGEKISAAEVEFFAHQVPGVASAAAVAVPDPDLGERVCLYVVPHPGADVRLADVREVMLAAGTAHFKLPERLRVVATIPDKKALRADIAARRL